MTDTTPTAAPDRSDAPAQDVNPQGVDLARKAGFPRDHKDARIAVIDPANVNGEYGVLNGSHPAHDEATPAAWSSDHLHGLDDGASAVGPTDFARSGGTPRKK